MKIIRIYNKKKESCFAEYIHKSIIKSCYVEYTNKSQPQYKGIILKIFNMTPKKPNSALRKVAKVQLKNKSVLAYIPGEKHSLNIHNIVLIRPGKVQDLVNVHYKIIRGVLDAKAPIRSTSRSKYGTKKKD